MRNGIWVCETREAKRPTYSNMYAYSTHVDKRRQNDLMNFNENETIRDDNLTSYE